MAVTISLYDSLTERVWHDLNKLRAATGPGPAAGSGAALPGVAADR